MKHGNCFAINLCTSMHTFRWYNFYNSVTNEVFCIAWKRLANVMIWILRLKDSISGCGVDWASFYHSYLLATYSKRIIHMLYGNWAHIPMHHGRLWFWAFYSLFYLLEIHWRRCLLYRRKFTHVLMSITVYWRCQNRKRLVLFQLIKSSRSEFILNYSNFCFIIQFKWIFDLRSFMHRERHFYWKNKQTNIFHSVEYRNNTFNSIEWA